MKSVPPLPLAGGDTEPNSAPVPQEDDGPRGPTTPQRLPLPWGEKAYLWLHPAPIQHPQHIIFPAYDSCLKGGEWKWWNLGLSKGEGHGDYQTSQWNVQVEAPDPPVNGCPDPDQTRQWLYKHPKYSPGMWPWIWVQGGGRSSHLDSFNGTGGPGQMTQDHILPTECGRRCREKEQWARESWTGCEGRGCSWQ